MIMVNYKLPMQTFVYMDLSPEPISITFFTLAVPIYFPIDIRI